MHLCCRWKQVASGRIEGIAVRVVFHAELVPYFDYPEIFCSVREKMQRLFAAIGKKPEFIHPGFLYIKHAADTGCYIYLIFPMIFDCITILYGV